MLIVTERIKLSLQNNKNIHHETLSELSSDVDNYEYNVISREFNKARDILINMKEKIHFCKQEIVITTSISLLKDELVNG